MYALFKWTDVTSAIKVGVRRVRWPPALFTNQNISKKPIPETHPESDFPRQMDETFQLHIDLAVTWM